LVELSTPVIGSFADVERQIGAKPMEATAPLT
jgi:hypothetical protein